jgi:hypothetical protein
LVRFRESDDLILVLLASVQTVIGSERDAVRRVEALFKLADAIEKRVEAEH